MSILRQRFMIGTAIILFGILTLCVPAVMAPFGVRVAGSLIMAASLATAWNLLAGTAGYWSFGHAGFVGLGAFSAALLEEHMQWGSANERFILGIGMAVLVTALISGSLSYPILRLRNAYFSIATLGVSLILSELFANVAVLEGAEGITLDPIGPEWMSPETFFYYCFLICLILNLSLTFCVHSTKMRYGLAAIAEDEDTAAMLGVPTTKYKTIVFVISAVLTGIVGAVYANSLGYVTAESAFQGSLGFDAVVNAMLGGVGTIIGPLIGAALMTFLTQVLLADFLQLHLMITGLVIIGSVLLLPAGIVGFIPYRHASRVSRRPRLSQTTLVVEPIISGSYPVLEVKDVSLSFGKHKALDQVSLEILPGRISTIIGPNGAGKSSLFNVITGFLAPSSGEVKLREQIINGKSTAGRSRLGIARAFQLSRPFRRLNVFENVLVGALFGRAGSADAAVVTYNALETCGLTELRERSADILTVGQLRRLEIARAIATRPTVILVDEPCAGLNPAESLDVVAALTALKRQGVAVVLVEHDMPTVMAISDEIWVIAAGANICRGQPEEVVNNRQVIEAYLGSCYTCSNTMATADGAVS